MQILVYSAGVALVCSLVTAGAMVHFFGSSDKFKGESGSSSSEGGSSKGSSKKEASHEGSESGERSGSSSKSSSTGESGSSEDSSSSKNTTPGGGSPKKASETAKLLEAETARSIAVRELHEAQKAEKESRTAEEDAKAILEFLKYSLLAASRPGGASVTQAFWSGGQGKDVTLRKAIDATEVRVAEAFAHRPLAEAPVREMLGLAYLNLGEPARPSISTSAPLRCDKPSRSPHHPDTAVCRNQLAIAYRLAGRADEASRLFETDPNSPQQATSPIVERRLLLEQKKAADAELKLRQSARDSPEDHSPTTGRPSTPSRLSAMHSWNSRNMPKPSRFCLSGYEGLRLREDTIPPRTSTASTRHSNAW